ncbi:MAG: adenylyl-sulfate kinase [Candidatus Omnitrophica bacterium]|nr:adenylyl-sulfate kinase [Candidatus Omnitrophota bacterium]
MRNGNGGVTLWFTGLPCSGKTTIAQLVRTELQQRGTAVELLDGDEIRKHFSAGVGFSKEDRSNHLKRVAYLCHLLTKHGVVVLASFVSPYRENRDYARQLIGERFEEVFVDTPLEECIRRDVKGMYKKALAGELKEFTGISDPYEPPLQPELVIRTVGDTVPESAAKVLRLLEQVRAPSTPVVVA